MAGFLDSLLNPQQQPLGGPQQPTFGQNFRQNLGPLMMAIGTDIASGGKGRGLAMLPGMIDSRQQRMAQMQEQQQAQQQQTQTAAFFRQKDPEIASMIEQGVIDGKTAVTMWQQKQQNVGEKSKRQLINAGEGRLYDADSGQWITAPGMPTEGQPGPADFDTEMKLRKEYNDVAPVKNYEPVRDAYERVRASAVRAQSDATGASDMAMIFNYMKMLDPGSVVRETEFANAAKSGGYGSQIQNLVSQITSGKMLTPRQRQEFVSTADALYGETSQNVSSANDRYGTIADQWRVPRDRVLTQPEKYEPLQIGGPPVEVAPGVTIKKVR